MKKIGTVITAMMVGVSILGGCGSGTDGVKESASHFKVGMVTDRGGIDDKSFNQSAWEGLQKFGEENNLVENEDYRYLASQSEADYVSNLTTFAEANFDMVFGTGFAMENAIKTVAADYPERHFAIIDLAVEGDNIASVVFKENEGSFLAGVAAAETTKTNKVGFIGGVETSISKKFEVGFRAGVESVNKDIEVIANYAGAFDKPETGSQLAATMYGQGIDIIYAAAGSTSNGVFTEAKTLKKNGKGVWVIGVDRDQHQEGLPENVTLTSVIKEVGNAVVDLSTKAKEGNFPSGKTLEYGLKEKGMGIVNGENVKESVQNKIADYKEKIIAGEITVPATEDEYRTFAQGLK